MAESTENLRRQAVQELRRGLAPTDVARLMDRSLSWVYKCRALYSKGGNEALRPKSRRPHHCAKALPPEVHAAIRAARASLEVEAAQPNALCYIGARAIQARLRQQSVTPLPGLSTIETEVRRAGLTHVRKAPPVVEVVYPHLAPQHAHELVQVDIVPHFLPGGTLVSAFNAVDTVSHYPTGIQCTHKRARDAVDFLLHVWRELGVPLYTQLDNEGCFSGGSTHRYVLGQVVRLGLWAGTQLLFSPYYHPESNGTVERFHQEYNRHTWRKQNFDTLESVQTASLPFFAAYRQSAHHSALAGLTPAQVHMQTALLALPDASPPAPLPLYSGRIHFLRKVNADQQIQVLNVLWQVPGATPNTGVWTTLDLTPKGAALSVFDAAPDAPRRRCLATHPFPLAEPVLPHPLSPPSQQTKRPHKQPGNLHLLTPFYDVLKVIPVVKGLLHSTMS